MRPKWPAATAFAVNQGFFLLRPSHFLHRLLILAVLVTLAGRAGAAPRLVARVGTSMGTQVRIAVFTEASEANIDRAVQAAFDELNRLEQLMTTWRDDSEVSRINQNAGMKPVVVSEDTFSVLQTAQQASRLSGGAFDVTYYALHGLWKFDDDLEARVPDAKVLADRLGKVNYRKLILDANRKTAFLSESGMALGVGGIGKGYAVDRVAEVMKRAGFANVIVQAGGDLLCAGSKGGAPWMAGIRDPRGESSDVLATLALSDHAFSTAGDYERFFILDGRRYHHIIDIKTGYPATRSRSVTVYAKTALWADALDDAVFVMGWQKGIKLVDSLPDVGAVIVDAHGKVHVSRLLKDKVQFLHPPLPSPN